MRAVSGGLLSSLRQGTITGRQGQVGFSLHASTLSRDRQVLGTLRPKARIPIRQRVRATRAAVYVRKCLRIILCTRISNRSRANKREGFIRIFHIALYPHRNGCKMRVPLNI